MKTNLREQLAAPFNSYKKFIESLKTEHPPFTPADQSDKIDLFWKRILRRK